MLATIGGREGTRDSGSLTTQWDSECCPDLQISLTVQVKCKGTFLLILVIFRIDTVSLCHSLYLQVFSSCCHSE